MKWATLIAGMIFAYCLVHLLLSGIDRYRLRVKKRLDAISSDKAADEKKGRGGKSKERSRLGFLNVSQSMKNQIQLSGIKLRPEEFMLVWILLIFVPAIISFLISPSALRSGALILAGAVSMPLYLRTKINKRRSLFERQLGDALLVLSNGLRAGFSFAQALDNVARDLADPIGPEFKSIGREIQLGGDIESALTKVTERMASADMKLLTTAVVVQQQVGGNLADIIDTIAKTIRERMSMKRSVKTMTAQGRISGRIIGLLPVAMLIIISVINPGYMQPFFTTTFGHVMLVVGVVMEVLGFVVIHKIVDIKF
ncbi:tight adherence protein B [Sporobacter termitidis DSM 10068]|uniref:Tight adherence protein B n=1 Tax=Sporobacter termitidis DSM 10068 TaxID=1123282 RepID=A0A1M5Z4Z4_9FIRM|nr:type II secretion system F family protein [Sporobacter termitidis]SHI18953.1 tight adherence protein B [Sporobacter termitidis DSM 10068]